MYIYGFYNFDYDDTTFTKLGHDKLFSKEEFENMVNECRILELDDRNKAKEKVDKYINTDLEYSDEEVNLLLTRSNEIYKIFNVENLLIKIYGFKELKPVYIFTFKGGTFYTDNKEENRVIEEELKNV